MPWKKGSALLKEVWFQVKKYSKSFGGKNLCSLRMDLSHQKKDYAFDLLSALCLNAQKFFSSRQPYIVKKIVKEIAYISSSYQAPVKARNFFYSLCKP